VSVRTTPKRGSIYILVLTSALVLTFLVVGLSRLLIRLRQANRTVAQIEQAEIHAQLGIRHALLLTRVASDWRIVLPNGAWLSDVGIGDAQYTVMGVDPEDADLTDDPSQVVQLACTATVGDVSRTLTVQARSRPSELLAYAAATGNDLVISNNVVIHGNVTANQDIDKSGAGTWILGDAEAVGTIDKTNNITGTITPGADPKVFPNPEDIRNYYEPRATTIAYREVIERVVIGPNVNPYGAGNPDGLYKIYCDNRRIIIRDCRIVGTLMIISPKNDSLIEKGINWQPAREDYPALLIFDGDFSILPDRNLNEKDLNTDLNLPGEPGYGFISPMQSYSNLITGTIYSNRDLTCFKEATIAGAVIVAGTLTLTDDASLAADDNWDEHPTHAFVTPPLVPIRGTWSY